MRSNFFLAKPRLNGGRGGFSNIPIPPKTAVPHSMATAVSILIGRRGAFAHVINRLP